MSAPVQNQEEVPPPQHEPDAHLEGGGAGPDLQNDEVDTSEADEASSSMRLRKPPERLVFSVSTSRFAIQPIPCLLSPLCLRAYMVCVSLCLCVLSKWGQCNYGELGHMDNRDRSTPTPIGGSYGRRMRGRHFITAQLDEWAVIRA